MPQCYRQFLYKASRTRTARNEHNLHCLLSVVMHDLKITWHLTLVLAPDAGMIPNPVGAIEFTKKAIWVSQDVNGMKYSFIACTRDISSYFIVQLYRKSYSDPCLEISVKLVPEGSWLPTKLAALECMVSGPVWCDKPWLSPKDRPRAFYTVGPGGTQPAILSGPDREVDPQWKSEDIAKVTGMVMTGALALKTLAIVPTVEKLKEIVVENSGLFSAGIEFENTDGDNITYTLRMQTSLARRGRWYTEREYPYYFEPGPATFSD
eukprot:sb/3468351/